MQETDIKYQVVESQYKYRTTLADKKNIQNFRAIVR